MGVTPIPPPEFETLSIRVVNTVHRTTTNARVPLLTSGMGVVNPTLYAILIRQTCTVAKAAPWKPGVSKVCDRCSDTNAPAPRLEFNGARELKADWSGVRRLAPRFVWYLYGATNAPTGKGKAFSLPAAFSDAKAAALQSEPYTVVRGEILLATFDPADSPEALPTNVEHVGSMVVVWESDSESPSFRETLYPGRRGP